MGLNIYQYVTHQGDSAVGEIEDTVYMVGAFVCIFVLTHLWVRRDFIQPVQRLLRQLDDETQHKPYTVPPLESTWKVWSDVIARVFAQNRKLVHHLEDEVTQRTHSIEKKNKALKKTLKELQQAQEQLILQEKLASLGTLTSGIAHELKNPLNFIINFSALNLELLDEGNRETADYKIIKDNMQRVVTHAHSAASIVQNMLRQAHKESDARQLVDLVTLVTEHVHMALISHQSNHPGFSVTYRYQGVVGPLNIAIVQEDIGRVMMNLVHNACDAMYDKYRQDSSYQPLLWIDLHQEDGVSIVRVADNGPGIPLSIAKKIFDPFFTTKQPGKGTGLGLYMCRDIIALRHKGTFDVLSRPGETVFTFTLPTVEPEVTTL